MGSHRSLSAFFRVCLLVIVTSPVGCTFVSRGSIVVSAAPPARAAIGVEDEVAGIVGLVVGRHGLAESWPLRRHAGKPCTMERGCIWSAAPSSFPWVSVSGASGNRVRVLVESRHDLPQRDQRVWEVTEEIARALRGRFGDAHVSSDTRG